MFLPIRHDLNREDVDSLIPFSSNKQTNFDPYTVQGETRALNTRPSSRLQWSFVDPPSDASEPSWSLDFLHHLRSSWQQLPQHSPDLLLPKLAGTQQREVGNRSCDPTPSQSEALVKPYVWSSLSLIIRKRTRRRETGIRGNNRVGRVGKPRCIPCRARRRLVVAIISNLIFSASIKDWTLATIALQVAKRPTVTKYWDQRQRKH
jgi:hypothetical protein